MAIALYRCTAAATLLAVLLAVFGCAAPSSVDHPTSLMGASVDEVKRAWGTPYFAYHDPDGGGQRLVYQFREEEWRLEFAIILVPKLYSHLYCFRLTVNDNGFVTDYETPSIWSSPYTTNCLQSFFGGDTADALFVAREHGKLDPLMWRAHRGDAVAAAVLADEFGETHYLRQRAESGDAGAAFAWYERDRSSPEDIRRALEIVCDAARGDDGVAQLRVAEILTESYWRDLDGARRELLLSAGFVPDDAFAYFWLRQAARNHAAGAAARLEEFEASMDSREVAIAKAWSYDPMTAWEKDRFWNALSPEPAHATECPVPLTEANDRRHLMDRKLAAMAAAGDARAAGRLKDTATLERLGAGGDTAAAAILAVEFGDPRFALSLAARGDREIGFQIYRRTPAKHKYSSAAWKWLCQSAGAGNAEARRSIGFWFRSDRQARAEPEIRAALDGIGIKPDDTRAYMWYALADEVDSGSPNTVIPERLRRNLSPGQIAKAQQMARHWKPGDCLSAEHRLGPPSGT